MIAQHNELIRKEHNTPSNNKSMKTSVLCNYYGDALFLLLLAQPVQLYMSFSFTASHVQIRDACLVAATCCMPVCSDIHCRTA